MKATLTYLFFFAITTASGYPLGVGIASLAQGKPEVAQAQFLLAVYVLILGLWGHAEARRHYG